MKPTIAIAIAAVVSACVACSAEPPTKGRIPDAAFGLNGAIDRDQIPDFVVAYKKDGSLAGYVGKQALVLGDDIIPSTLGEDIPVVDESLTRVVGHMVPGVGFVALAAQAPKQ